MVGPISALALTLLAASTAAAGVDRRIVKGQDARPDTFTSLVSIQDEKGYYCGGSLVDSTTVVTAAHCVAGKAAKSSFVKAGSLSSTTGGVDAPVDSITMFPGFQNDKEISVGTPFMVHDIAILKLAKAIEISNTTSYAKLPAPDSTPRVNSTALAAGWGRPAQGSSLVTQLRTAEIPIRACTDFVNLAGVGTAENIPRTIVCAGEQNGRNVCKGDSGGPLIDQKTGELIGVVSWSFFGPNFELCQTSAAFSKVSSYLSFIEQGMKPGGAD